MKKISAAVVVLALALNAMPSIVFAASFPERAVRLVVPVAAGGSIDVTARVVGEALSKRWGQPVVVENRPGAGMVVGTMAVAKAPADGYTLLVGGAGPMTINVAAIPDLSYDPRRDFKSVAMISSLPYMLMVNAALPAKSADELIRYAKQNPGKLNVASGGPAAQLAGALFKKKTGIDFVEVPYKGANLSVTSVVSNETQVTFADTATPGIDNPNIRILAVTSAARVGKWPQVPTLAESGLAGTDFAAWIGLFAPHDTPAAVVAQIEKDVLAVLADPAVRTRLQSMQMQVENVGSEALQKRIEAEIETYSTLIKETGLKLR